MIQRDAQLIDFLETLHQGIISRSGPDGAVRRLIDTIMGALATPARQVDVQPVPQPACRYLDPAVSQWLDQDGQVRTSIPAGEASAAAHALAIAALADRLVWWRRPDAPVIGEPFLSGHANATIIGKGGLEEREDVWIGISLLAPDIDYPVHRHPPEEVYLVLTPGHWQHGAEAWQEPGPGGIFHNTPFIDHAMRSGSVPLLATWCLWVG